MYYLFSKQYTTVCFLIKMTIKGTLGAQVEMANAFGEPKEPKSGSLLFEQIVLKSALTFELTLFNSQEFIWASLGHRHVALGVRLASLFPNQDDKQGDPPGPECDTRSKEKQS